MIDGRAMLKQNTEALKVVEAQIQDCRTTLQRLIAQREELEEARAALLTVERAEEPE